MPEIDAGVGEGAIESDHTTTVPQAADGTEQISKAKVERTNITTALANAGHSLEGAETELVLNPLRLAFESKNVKVQELALDCLHVRVCFDCEIDFEKFCFISHLRYVCIFDMVKVGPFFYEISVEIRKPRSADSGSFFKLLIHLADSHANLF